jgi:hypothetical protein
MADFSGSGSAREFGGGTSPRFRNPTVPSMKDAKKSPFWKLAFEIADSYKGKVNPKTKRKYTREERLHIGISTAGKIASRQRTVKKTKKH